MQRLNKCKDSPPSLLRKRDAFFNDCGNNDTWTFYCNNKKKYDYRTSEVKRLLLESSGGRCAVCSRSIYDANLVEDPNSENVFTIEHIVPREEDPSQIFEWRNMIPCCSSCNNSRKNKAYIKGLYIDPSDIENIEDFFGFSYDGSIYCNKSIYAERVDYMIRLYNLNSVSGSGGLKPKRRWYYKLIIDEDYQRVVKLNEKFGLSDNIIIFKDMYMFNERNT